MKNKFNVIVSIFVILLFLCCDSNAEILSKNSQIEFKQRTFQSKFDSLVIRYWDASMATGYTITLKQNQINVSNDDSRLSKNFTNPDSVYKMWVFINDLFVSGKEPTEVKRTYRHLVFADYSSIEISIYSNHQLYVKHTIDLGMDNCDIAFSDTFRKFYKLLDELCEQVM